MKVTYEDVLNYLKYDGQEIDDNLKAIIRETIEETLSIIRPKHTYSFFDNTNYEDRVDVDNIISLKGADISKLLKKSSRCIIFCATIGQEIETRINYYKISNLTKTLIMDACASAAIEEVCDNMEQEIRDIDSMEGLSLTFRYSPGYGDLDISYNQQIVNILSAPKKIGLTCSEHNILLPRKSVAGIIGIIKEEDDDRTIEKNGRKFRYRCVEKCAGCKTRCLIPAK